MRSIVTACTFVCLLNWLAHTAQKEHVMHCTKQIELHFIHKTILTLLVGMHATLAFQAFSAKGISFIRARSSSHPVMIDRCNPLPHISSRGLSLTSKHSLGQHKAHKVRRQDDTRPMSAEAHLTLKIKKASNVSDLMLVFEEHAASFNHIHASAFWNALGKQSRKERTWLDKRAASAAKLRNSMDGMLSTCGARELANVAHGMAKAGVTNEDEWVAVWADLANRVARHMREFNSQDCANIAWAFTKANAATPELFEALSHEAIIKLKTFNAQDLANTVWAFAMAGIESQWSV